MKGAPWTVVGLATAAALLAAAGLLWPSPSTAARSHKQGSNPNDQACGDCHEGSVPLYHTDTFRAVDHGQAARVARTTCLSCHDDEDFCQACHEKAPPTWHTEAFQHPGRGRVERAEHVRLSVARGASCMECHARRFLGDCAECHQPTEWDTPEARPPHDWAAPERASR